MKNCRELKFSKLRGFYGPGMQNVKQKDNGIDQITLHSNVMITISTLDKYKKEDTMFVNLSRASDTLNHDLLLAKLNAYGFSFNAIKIIQR